jgi:transposase InsO family protein
MPWKETQKMDQRVEFAMKALVHPNFRELCREYGISAKTGYKWRERFVQHGLLGLNDLSRRPHGHAAELGEAVVCAMVRLKQAHPHWGPRKIQALYQRKHGGEVPSESSFKRVLERAGLTVPRRVRRSTETGRLGSGRKATAPNEVWSVDFKGWWRDRDGLRVEPLTVRDEHSRMLLEMRALENIKTATLRRCFEGLFERYGLPGAIRSDNGVPFASARGLHGLSRLSAWWLVLGIDLERGRPGCPQDNGAHERMHLDIRRELEGGRVGRDQAAFDLWREEYNTERPHEALGMRVPAEVYERSGRAYEGTPTEIDYGGMETRKVRDKSGVIGYQQERIMITSAIGGWTVGLSPQANGLVEVWFSKLLLGHIDPESASFKAAQLGRLEAGQNAMEKCNP